MGDPWLGRQAWLELSSANRALAALEVGALAGSLSLLGGLSWLMTLGRESQALQSSANIIWCSRRS